MSISLPVELEAIAEELNYEHGRLIYEGVGGNEVRRSILPGGVRVITEKMPGTRGVSIGFWVGVGSRDEAPGMLGSTHFLEHLLFKGTASRDAHDIAEAFDMIGGESNAATSKEHTSYYARVLAPDSMQALDVLADMVASSLLEPTDVETERGVIVSELADAADDPADVAQEAFARAAFGEDTPLGRPIGGTNETVTAVPRDAVWEHYKRYYTPDRLVISAAGSLEHSTMVRLVLEALTRYGWNLQEGVAPAPRRVRTDSGILPLSELREVEKGFEQTNIVMGCPSIIAGDDRRYAMSVLTSAFGAGMSSRLFQEIREKRGLAYSTFAFSGAYSDAGYFGMYAGCLPAKTEQVREVMGYEFDKLATAGITEEELTKVRGQLAGSTVLGSEDSGSRMSRLGRAELDSGLFTSTDELLEKIRAVSLEEVRDLAAYLGQQQMITTIVR